MNLFTAVGEECKHGHIYIGQISNFLQSSYIIITLTLLQQRQYY